MEGLSELATIYPNVKILHFEVDLRNNRLDFKVVFCTSNLFQGIVSMDNPRVLLFVIFFLWLFFSFVSKMVQGGCHTTVFYWLVLQVYQAPWWRQQGTLLQESQKRYYATLSVVTSPQSSARTMV